MAKKYAVNVEKNEVVSVEVDGVTYEDPDQVPDAADRARIEQLMSQAEEAESDPEFDKAFEDFDEEFREMEKQSAKFPAVIVGVFLIVAGITLTIAILSGISTARAAAREVSAPGEVVDMVARTSQGGRNSQGTYVAPQDYYYPVVAFTLPDGTPKTVQLGEGSWPPAYEKGEQVTVRYDPQKPIYARIQSTASDVLMWLLPGITGIVGVSFLLAAGFVGWFFKKGEREQETQATGRAGNQVQGV